ncbi:ankyrin repeat-containing domain protein [Podospora didyma]|uniref:Ankyrin repeat-containing domain protein n=1 Tax=Podospora didyma TaxID=330526 RepID=A0AAE0TZT8_9PEZI|nr:ankyrin repeat-containing domain protein [Podospora didyma]
MVLLTALPTELLVAISDNVDPRDLCSLSQTNRRLFSIANPILYHIGGVKRMRALPLLWAAKNGVPGTLRHALAAGANPDHAFRLSLTEFASQTISNFEKAEVSESEDLDYLPATPNNPYQNPYEDDFVCDDDFPDWPPDDGSEGEDEELEEDFDEEPEEDDIDADLEEDLEEELDGDESEQDEFEDDDDELQAPDVAGDAPHPALTLAAHPSPPLALPPLDVAVRMGIGDRRSVLLREYTALHVAAKEGHTEIIRMLLDAGAKINTGNRPLEGVHSTWQCATRPDAAKYLNSRGANLFPSRRAAKYSIIHQAAAFGNLDLLTYNSSARPTDSQALDLNIKDARDLTPLFNATANGLWETTVPFLLEHGADIDSPIRIYKHSVMPPEPDVAMTLTRLVDVCRLGRFDDAFYQPDAVAAPDHERHFAPTPAVQARDNGQQSIDRRP